MKDKLAIFDMDGTLFDTKDVNYKAYCEAIRKCGYEIEVDYQYYCDFCNGNNYRVFLPIIIPNISTKDMEQIHRYKKDEYPKYLQYAKKNEHLFSIIREIKRSYYVALVTTASKENTEDILNAFNEIEGFDFVITQEDVTRTKPNPECFLLTMDKAGVTRENTIIFEDSETGLTAAKASGAHYVQIYGYN